jgi:hypothetical protein
MDRYAAPLVAFLIFIAIYGWLQRRRGGQIQWGWLAAVVACASVAILLSYVV